MTVHTAEYAFFTFLIALLLWWISLYEIEKLFPSQWEVRQRYRWEDRSFFAFVGLIAMIAIALRYDWGEQVAVAVTLLAFVMVLVKAIWEGGPRYFAKRSMVVQLGTASESVDQFVRHRRRSEGASK